MSTTENTTRDRWRPDTLLPMVRAAMERGEGPPVVLAWVRANGHDIRNEHWSSQDEARARALAGRLAATLTRPSRNDARTLPLGETFLADRFSQA